MYHSCTRGQRSTLSQSPSDHQLNWERAIAGGLEVHEIPGDHAEVIT